MKIRSFGVFALLAWTCGFGGTSSAAILASYEFEGPQSGVNTVAANGGNSASFAPTTTAAGLTASNLFATGGGTASSSVRIGALAGLGYAVAQGNVLVVDTPGGGDTNNLANYFSITITPNVGTVIDFDTLTLLAARSGGATPRGFKVRSSLDAFTATLNGAETEAFATQRPTLTGYTINLGSPAFNAISSQVEFRFYPFAPSLGQTIDMDSFAFNGTIIPEASSLALALVGLIGAGGGCRRSSWSLIRK